MQNELFLYGKLQVKEAGVDHITFNQAIKMVRNVWKKMEGKYVLVTVKRNKEVISGMWTNIANGFT